MKKRNVKMVLLVELILLLIVFAITVPICFRQGLSGMCYLIDAPSMIGILLFAVPGMMILGAGRDFCKAFSVGQKKYTLLELKNIIEAVKACQKLVVIGGLFEMLIASIAILATLDDLTVLGPNLAVMILSGLYIVILEYFLLPLYLNTQKTLHEEMCLDEEI